MTNFFPFNYMKVMFSPRRIFQERNYLKVWQIILVILLINSLMMIPVAFQVGRSQGADLENYVPQTIELLNQEVVDTVRVLPQENGRLEIAESQIIHESDGYLVALAENEAQGEEFLSGANGLVFMPDKFFIQEDGSLAANQPYVNLESLGQVETVEDLNIFLSEAWYWMNRPSIILTNYIYIGLMIFISLLMVILGSSFFLSLMKKNENFHIRSYKEALTMVINANGLPAILAFAVGMITGNPIHILTTHSISFVLWLLWVYWNTHFNDEYTETKMKSKEKK